MEELVRKAKEGNKEAFTELILQIKEELYKITKTRLQNEDDVYDAIQETMIIAFKSIKKLKEDKYFKTWIIRILINECNQIFKKRKNENIVSYDDVQNHESVKNQTEMQSDILDFKFLCDKLEYKDRIIIMLYYMEKYTDKEIGEILKLKENTVRTKRNRIKQKIKKILEKEEK